MFADKRMKYVRAACTTRRSEALLLGAQSGYALQAGPAAT